MAVVVALTGMVVYALLFFSGGLEIPECTSATEACIAGRQIELDHSLYLASVIGIALSAIGTVALVLTIFLSKQATDAAVEASRAANEAIQLTKESSTREFRPYIRYHTHSMYFWKDASGDIANWRVHLTWINAGITPAINVRTILNSTLAEKELPPDFPFTDRDVNSVAGTLGKDQTVEARSDWMSATDIQRVVDGDLQLYVWGWIEYEGFEVDRIYRTEFHVRLHLSGSDEQMKCPSTYIPRFNGMDSKSYHPPQPRKNR